MLELLLLAASAAHACTVTDGDTLHCGDERVRLLGIDAPEMGGRCRAGRVCVPGDPDASKAALGKSLSAGPIRIERVDRDRYGRTLAIVWAGPVNLSCAQVRSGHAVYVENWDNGRALARSCRLP